MQGGPFRTSSCHTVYCAASPTVLNTPWAFTAFGHCLHCKARLPLQSTEGGKEAAMWPCRHSSKQIVPSSQRPFGNVAIFLWCKTSCDFHASWSDRRKYSASSQESMSYQFDIVGCRRCLSPVWGLVYMTTCFARRLFFALGAGTALSAGRERSSAAVS